jgi:SAM-dependent methyltransferase
VGERSACVFCGGREIRPLNHYGPRCLVGDYRITSGHVENVWCVRCGLGWNRRMMDEDELAGFYAGYEKKTETDEEDDLLFGPAGTEVETLTASQVRFVAPFVDGIDRGRVLDIGCGKGAFLTGFSNARKGWEYVGVEPSRKEAGIARRNPMFEIHEGMFGGVDLGAASFDLVAIMHVLEHVSDPPAVIERIHDALRPGGLAFIEVPHTLDLNMFYDLLLFEHLYHFTPETLSWDLERQGFDIVAIDASSSYGALRVVARKRTSPGNRTTSPAALPPMADGFERWIRMWARMREVCAIGAAQAARGRRVGIFGAGMTSATWLVYSDLFDSTIVGCLDESRWKIGRSFFGRPVRALADLTSLELDTLLVATMPGSQAAVTAKLRRVAPASVEILPFE